MAIGVSLIGIFLVLKDIRAGRPIRRSPSWARVQRVLAGVLAALLALGLANAAISGVLRWDSTAAAAVPRETHPDIYVLLLDGYARADTLAQMGLDLSPFERELEQRGFEISPHSHSNYMKTWASLAAMFDLRHVRDIPGLPPPDAPGGVQNRALSNVIRHSRGLKALRAHGYRIVASAAAIPDLTLTTADLVMRQGHLSGFELALLRNSPITRIGPVADLLIADHAHRVRDRFQSAVRAAELAQSTSQPQFTWIHVTAPHPPFALAQPPHVCFPKCSFFEVSAQGQRLDRADYNEAFVDQTEALNALVLKAVDGILAASESPPVIVLMSDHGSRHLDEDPAEFFRSFFAALTPGMPGLFPQDNSVSATLARLLNGYLDADVDVPDDDVHYMSTWAYSLDLVPFHGCPTGGIREARPGCR
jgi:hypothetical protein